MKVSQVLCAVFLSSLLIVGRSAPGVLISAIGADGTTADASQYPATFGTTTTIASATANTGVTSGQTYNAAFQGTPITSIFTLRNEGAAGSPPAVSILVNLRLGSQVSVQLLAAATPTGTTANAPTPVLSGATSGTPTLTSACGTYSLDCAGGTITFTLNAIVAGTTNADNTFCVFQVNQIAAITGILQYATAPTAPYTNVIQAIQNANNANSPVTIICGTGTLASSNTFLLYFVSTYGGTTVAADQTTAFNRVRSAAAAGNLNSNTGYSVSQLARTATGQTTAPSAAAANSISRVTSSENRIMVVAGLISTAAATCFALVL